MKEPECFAFMASVPTVWDETVALTGSVGEYIAIARRSGDTWYIGAMTDWTPRELELDLSFIGNGNYDVESFADGINADRAARDFRKTVSELPQAGAFARFRLRFPALQGIAGRIARNEKAAACAGRCLLGAGWFIVRRCGPHSLRPGPSGSSACDPAAAPIRSS